MDQLLQAAGTLLAAMLAALALRAIQAAQVYIDNMVQQRLGQGAARVAGDIISTVAGDASVQAASQAMIEAGAAQMQRRFPDTAGKLPVDVVAGMIRGELGKLGQAVTP